MSLPVVCMVCGCIAVDGKEVPFPEQLEQHAKAAAEQAAELAAKAVREAVQDIENDPDRVARYFSRVYRTAYLDGFWRALVFFRYHSAKEGRLRRLRDLWSKASVMETTAQPDVGRIRRLRTLALGPDEYAEFEYLLFLGAKEPPHASDSTDQRASLR